MKDLSLSLAGVLILALAMALVFHWVYPLVEMTGDLAALFGFVALALKLAVSKLWALWHKPAAEPGK